MAKLVHNITITIFEKDIEKIPDHKQTLQYVLPVDFVKEKVDFSIETVEGFSQKPIHILRLKTEKSRHNKQILNSLFSNLQSADKKLIGKQYLTRINDVGFFFIRIKKKDILKHKFLLTESGDCYHFKIKLAGFPANWDQFVNAARSLLIKYNCLDKDGSIID
jgi:RNA binding exosome subunit